MTIAKAGIFILTQNTIERKIYLKNCLYFLFKNFNKKYNYPVIILHEGDYDDNAQSEIKNSIRQNHRHVVTFKQIDKGDFDVPSHIDKERLEKVVELQPVPYWRNGRYRSMCYFWIKHFFKYTNDFDYVMRLDDDSIIEEPIVTDLFQTMVEKEYVYISNLLHVDCGICNYGMKEMFEKILPSAKSQLNDKMFIKSKIPKNTVIMDKFKELYRLNEGKNLEIETFNDDIETEMPLMYYNNFFITDTRFWKREEVKYIIDAIDKHGGIFYYRYGDAPLHTIIVSLLEPRKTTRTVFKYSKRLQREVFVDNDGNFHSYMPKSYDHSSCITHK
jgi:alpha 1,2-mannosyltransferase